MVTALLLIGITIPSIQIQIELTQNSVHSVQIYFEFVFGCRI